MALLLLAASASGQSPENTQPFHWSEGFEDANDPVHFWTSYKKEYTVHFKGVTDELARSGEKAFKLDVTFDEPSRFLWHIPLAHKVPASGDLEFSGYLLLGEETTARVTLGVSFALPPTRHGGCTAWGSLVSTTDGQWKHYTDLLVPRGLEKANLIVGRDNWGLAGENVGPVVERIIIDVRAEAGQRAVLYVDDLELKGHIPTDEDYRKETDRRWAAYRTRLDEKISDWQSALRQGKQELSTLQSLPPLAEQTRTKLLARTAELETLARQADKQGEIRRQDQQQVDSFLEHLAGSAVNIRAIQAAEKEGRRAVLYITPPISAKMILPHEVCVLGAPADQLAVTAARGEYEPASFVVSALEDINELNVTVSDLRGDQGTIPSAQVDVRSVKCWYQAGTAWVGVRQDKSHRILTPELLLHDDALVKVDDEKQENYVKLAFPDGERYEWISDRTEVAGARSLPVEKFPVRDSPVLLPLDLPAGTSKQFWLTLHVPADAAPETYRGTVTLSTPKGSVHTLPLTVHVLPFDLLPPYYTSSMDYHGRLDPSGKGTIGSWLKSRKQFRAELANMVAHGLRNCQHYSIPKEMLGEVLEIRRDVGMDNRTLYLKSTIPIGNPTDGESLAAIKQNVRDILEFTKPYGAETVYFYGMDERRGEELASQRAAWTAVRAAGGKIFVAGWGDNLQMMADIQDMHVRAGWPNRDEVARWHALGHKIFCYNNPQTGVENPLVYRRNFGLLLWKFDYDGAATNAYQHTFGATWNDFDHPIFRAHTIAYPTVDGVIDTLAWEGYREAVDDVRYVTTLAAAVETARNSTDARLRTQAAAAAAFLRDLKTGETIENDNPSLLRQSIIEHLLRLQP